MMQQQQQLHNHNIITAQQQEQQGRRQSSRDDHLHSRPQYSHYQPTVAELSIAKSFLRTSMATVWAYRKLASRSCFLERPGPTGHLVYKFLPSLPSMGGSEYKQRDLDNIHAFTRWLDEGVFDALEKGHLKAATLCLTTPKQDRLIEAYKFEVTKDSNYGLNLPNGMTLTPSKTFSSQHQPPSEEEVKVAMAAALESLVDAMQEMETLLLPSSFAVSMKLDYNANAPVRYEPEHFQAASVAQAQVLDDEPNPALTSGGGGGCKQQRNTRPTKAPQFETHRCGGWSTEQRAMEVSFRRALPMPTPPGQSQVTIGESLSLGRMKSMCMQPPQCTSTPQQQVHQGTPMNGAIRTGNNEQQGLGTLAAFGCSLPLGARAEAKQTTTPTTLGETPLLQSPALRGASFVSHPRGTPQQQVLRNGGANNTKSPAGGIFATPQNAPIGEYAQFLLNNLVHQSFLPPATKEYLGAAAYVLSVGQQREAEAQAANAKQPLFLFTQFSPHSEYPAVPESIPCRTRLIEQLLDDGLLAEDTAARPSNKGIPQPRTFSVTHNTHTAALLHRILRERLEGIGEHLSKMLQRPVVRQRLRGCVDVSNGDAVVCSATSNKDKHCGPGRVNEDELDTTVLVIPSVESSSPDNSSRQSVPAAYLRGTDVEGEGGALDRNDEDETQDVPLPAPVPKAKKGRNVAASRSCKPKDSRKTTAPIAKRTQSQRKRARP